MATATIVGALLPQSVAQAAPTSVSTWAMLSSAVASGHNVVLAADISQTGDTLAVPGGKADSVDLNGHVLTIVAGAGAPAVSVASGGELILKDPPGHGSASFTGGTGAAGIGLAADATFAVRSAFMTQLDAVGGVGGAGIGGAAGAPGGIVSLDGGITTATGGSGAAGIGGGAGGGAGTLSVGDGQVTATGGAGGAGIGGGTGGSGGAVDITGGFVSSRATMGGFGVGAGSGGTAGATAVAIGASGSLELTGSHAISLGALDNAGLLRLKGNSVLSVPAGVTVENSGLIRLRGTLSGTGTVHNTGAILPTPIGTTDAVADNGQGPAGTALLVSEHNYTVAFTLDGLAGTTPDSVQVYAKGFASAHQSLPAVPASPGLVCADSWFTAATGGTPVLDNSMLSTLTTTGPSTVLLHRHCSTTEFTVTFDPEGGAPAPAQQTVGSGQYATEPSAPSKPGDDFDGWFTAAASGSRWAFADDQVTADITLYAQYTAVTTSPTSPVSTSASTSVSSSSSSSSLPTSSTSASTSTLPTSDPSTAVPTTSVVPTSTSTSTSTVLADTGAHSESTLDLGLLLLVAGGGLLIAGRRRTSPARRH